MIYEFNCRLFYKVCTIPLVISAYVVLVGYSSNHSSMIAAFETSQSILADWPTVSRHLGVPLNRTKPGDLAPVVPQSFRALELLIYGDTIVEEDFKKTYRSYGVPSHINDVNISVNNDKSLVFEAGGIQLAHMDFVSDSQGIAYFYDVPWIIIAHARSYYDGDEFWIKSATDSEGIIRHSLTKDSKWLMGVYHEFDPLEMQ